jgi:tetratricopeptide (TPR) repeat protein
MADVSGDQAGRDGGPRTATQAWWEAAAAPRDQSAGVAERPPAEAPPQESEPPPVPEPAHAPAGERVLYALPREPPDSLPRTDLLAELDRAGARVLVLRSATGIRGVGTTQLAAAYARARLAEDGRLVAWVSAADAGTLQAGLAALADSAGLSEGGTKHDPGDPGLMVRHRLETDGDRCLLVFDDVSDPAALRPFLPAAGAAQILITSNRESDLGPNIAVGVFSEAEAQAFLAKRTGIADNAAAAAVAAELGYLPLALASAAAVISGQHLGYETYLGRLRALSAGEYLTREQDYPSGAAQAVLLSLEALWASDPSGVCAGAMELMSVLSAAGVRRDLLHAAGQAGALGGRWVAAGLVDQALERLAVWSLLTPGLDGQTIIAHRLVAGVVREGLTRQGRLVPACRRAAALLEARAQELVGSPDRMAIRDLPQQVTALADAARPLARHDEWLAHVLLRLRFFALYHLIELGDSATQAIMVGEPLTADLERARGPDHPDTLNSRNSLAAAYQAAGRPAEAAPLFEQTLVGRQRLLGPEHPDTLTSQNNLAAAYQDAGRADEARLLFEMTLAARERILGASHPSTLNSRGNLATAYRDAGRIANAVPLFEQTLAGRERVLGADHPDTLHSRQNLAAAYREAGRVADAIPLVEQILAARERLLGADHPSTLNARNNLAAAYREAGLAAKAIPLVKQTLAAYQRLLGADHPRTLGARNNLANAYRDVGRLDEAIPLHEQTLAACERLLGTDHARTLGSRSNLATAYQEAGRVDEAIELHEQTLASRERLLGDEHPSTLNSRNNLASAYREAGRVDEAILLFERTLAGRERVLGADHPDTVTTRNSLALAQENTGSAE